MKPFVSRLHAQGFAGHFIEPLEFSFYLHFAFNIPRANKVLQIFQFCLSNGHGCRHEECCEHDLSPVQEEESVVGDAHSLQRSPARINQGALAVGKVEPFLRKADGNGHLRSGIYRMGLRRPVECFS